MKTDCHLTGNLYGKECFKEVIVQVITEENYREVANFKQDKHLASYNLGKTYLHISCTKLI